ncbi:MAG: hypothetical protein HY953_03290 [Candidatus Rokubacteria bacterium]|nr:hypothetical protein [Candidatus Rokubacteria bacterium]
MGKVDGVERRVKDLSADWEVWDRKLERDVATGKLDSLADKALREYSEGKSTRL